MIKGLKKLAVATLLFLIVTALAAVAVSADSTEPPDALIDDIVNAMLAFEQRINVEKYAVTQETARNAFIKVKDTHPEIFWVNRNFGLTYGSDGIVKSMGFYYTMDKSRVAPIESAIEAEYANIVRGILPGMTDAEKVLVVNDYMCINYEYDTTYVADGAYELYGVMINKTGVCDSYSKAFLYVMNRLGIECKRMTSDKMKTSHAWNCVKIDGKWYHVDVTWNDPINDNIGLVSHDYLLVSDYNINENYSASGRNRQHYGWNDIGITCDSDIYENAVWRNSSRGIVFDSENMYMFTKNKQLQAVNRKSGSVKTLYTISENYPVQGGGGSYWTGCFSNILPINGKIYFNTPKKIYSINKDGTGLTLFKDLSSESGYIYGMRSVGNTVYYGLGTDPNSKISVSGSFSIGSIPTVYIEDSVGTVGKEFAVNVNVKNNEGISSLECSINFDSTVLDYVGVSLADANVTVKNGNISFTSNANINTDGKLFTLRFRVKEGTAVGQAQVGIVASDTKITASDGNVAEIGAANADVEITKTYFGDTSGDGVINSSDGVALAQSLASWAISIDKTAADVNRDGIVDSKDSVMLAQYLAKWDIILGKKAA